jgi:excisionase family DNA binding protein
LIRHESSPETPDPGGNFVESVRDAAHTSGADSDLHAMPPVLTSKEVARVLRVGVREVRSLVASGQLAGARVGPRKVIRISKLAVFALLKVRDAF